MSDHECPRIDYSGRIPTVYNDRHCDVCHTRTKAKYGRYVKFLPDLRKWMDGDDIGQDCRHFLYEHFMEEMPYGTQKARDGDPDNWLADHPELIEELIATIEFYHPGEAEDPTPLCPCRGAKSKSKCICGPRAEND